MHESGSRLELQLIVIPYGPVGCILLRSHGEIVLVYRWRLG